ncbi:hypothetical protein AOLI_G00278150 [Acnodon oligacanthus]
MQVYLTFIYVIRLQGGGDHVIGMKMQQGELGFSDETAQVSGSPRAYVRPPSLRGELTSGTGESGQAPVAHPSPSEAGRSTHHSTQQQAREERDDKLMANALRRGCQHSRLPLKAPVARADCGGMNQSLPVSVILRGPGPKSTRFLRKLRCTAAASALSVMRVALLFALQ